MFCLESERSGFLNCKVLAETGSSGQDLVTEDEAAVAGCKCCFHSSCITQYVTSIDLDGSKQPGCPVCFKPLTVALQLERKTEEQVNTAPRSQRFSLSLGCVCKPMALRVAGAQGGDKGGERGGGRVRRQEEGSAEGQAEAGRVGSRGAGCSRGGGGGGGLGCGDAAGDADVARRG